MSSIYNRVGDIGCQRVAPLLQKISVDNTINWIMPRSGVGDILQQWGIDCIVKTGDKTWKGFEVKTSVRATMKNIIIETVQEGGPGWGHGLSKTDYLVWVYLGDNTAWIMDAPLLLRYFHDHESDYPTKDFTKPGCKPSINVKIPWADLEAALTPSHIQRFDLNDIDSHDVMFNLIRMDLAPRYSI